MSMQIKTIAKRLEDTEAFDAEVNAVISEGWHLNRREILMPPAQPNDGVHFLHMVLIAELVKEDTDAQEPEPAPITWQQAVETIKGICSGRADCITGDECPMFCYCHTLNVDWGVPFEWPEVPHD